jgi:hypothetical protein
MNYIYYFASFFRGINQFGVFAKASDGAQFEISITDGAVVRGWLFLI